MINLPAGTYEVRIPAAEFGAGGTLENYISSTGNATNNTDSNDNGVDPAPPDNYAAGLASNVFDLERDSEPTGESDLNIGGSSGEGLQGTRFVL